MTVHGKKNILILNTGGTISSIKTPRGYEPISHQVEKILKEISILSHPDMPHYTIHEYQPLIDSSNMTPSIWNQIAQDIERHYHDYDGFVIFHGTDTMAYTASALSFMLENLSKPVILTGSQIPLTEIRNDAIDNVMTSLWLATQVSLKEVCIYFNQHLLRGNRAQKVSSTAFRAFDSPNFPHLATVGVDISLKKEFLHSKPEGAFHVQYLTPHRIANLRLFPGFTLDILEALLCQPIDALIIETYGSGNAPSHDPDFLKMLEKAIQQGTLIVNASQCPHGSVLMGQYETGYTLKHAGLVSAGDMTLETVHCKLLYLLSKYRDKSRIKKQFTVNLVGELTA
jgi:L-asparaginase